MTLSLVFFLLCPHKTVREGTAPIDKVTSDAYENSIIEGGFGYEIK